jgi:transcription termination factor NusB
MKDIPVAVVISEAVQLAKRFGDSTDYVFINGALSSFEKSLPEDGRTEDG